MLCLQFRVFAENSFREWSERECRYLVGLVRVGQTQVQWISLGVGWGETNRRQNRHAESGVHYGGQVLSENTDNPSRTWRKRPQNWQSWKIAG